MTYYPDYGLTLCLRLRFLALSSPDIIFDNHHLVFLTPILLPVSDAILNFLIT